jgi:prepilin peptidase CpaA
MQPYVQSILWVCIPLLLYAAWTDLAYRIIPNCLCFGIFAIAATSQVLIGPGQLLRAVALGLVVLLVLWIPFAYGMIGGGDVKLLAATSVALSFRGTLKMFAVTALAGGIIVLIHLAMRHLPRPRRQAGNSLPQRVYAIERWRILRRASLPYGVAIACGATLALLGS